jgi:alpha-tubulin suppressor-like RCC1 family protein
MMMSSLSLAYSYSNPVYLTNMLANYAYDGSITANFSVAGGTNFVPYDIEMSTNLSAPDWSWQGIAYTSNNYTLYEQPTDSAFYRLAKPSKTLVIAWGNNNGGQCNVPLDLTNAIEVTGGAMHSIALLNNSNVVAWGDNTYGQTNVPADLTNAVVVVANVYHNLALRGDGTLSIWGKWQSNSVAFFDVGLPSDLTNITAIAAGPDYDLAVRADGSVVAWGSNTITTAYANVVTNLSPVMDVAAGAEHAVALLTNGTVTAWGHNYNGENETNVPTGLSHVVAIAAGDYHSVALKSDSTVVAWGAGVGNFYIDHGQSTVPAGLSNVVAIAAGGYRSVALKSDGTVVVWGDYTSPGFPLNQIIGIGSGWTHVLALRTGNTAPLITGQPADQYAPAGQTVSFSVSAIGLATLAYQWQSNGVAISGATSSTLTLTNVQAADAAAYNVVVTSSDTGGSVVSSNASFYLITPPFIISQSPLPTNQAAFSQSLLTLNVAADAPGQTNGFPLSYQWQLNGTNVGYGQSNYTFSAISPGLYSVTVSNAAGTATAGWQVNIITPGNAWGWGDDAYGQSTPPTGASNFIAVAAGTYHSVAVLENGSIVQWGDYEPDDFHAPIAPTPVGSPPTNSNIVAVAASVAHDLALTADGTVIQWGLTNASALQNFPTNLTGVKAISAGVERSLALLTNGTIVDWGSFAPFFNLNQRVPADLTNVTAISCGAYHWLALRSDGTVESWGYNTTFGETNVPAGLSNVVAIAGGGRHSLALKSDGTVVAWGDDTYGQCDVPAGLSNVMAIAAGDFHSVALQNEGTLVAWGDDSDGQTDTPILGQVKLLAAGGNHSLAVIFSPTVMYPVDVTKDLLLIYNTNSQHSATVLNYYLAHRPMVSGANVLGIGCVTNETTTATDFTNQILTPYLNWLTNNPTKRPQYLVLFMDIPSIVQSSPSSVQYQLYTATASGRPFVTSINMNGNGGTNDCIAYINKLATVGVLVFSNSPVLSASANGYGNTNYILDNVNNLGYGYPESIVSNAITGLVAAGVPTNFISYLYGFENGFSLPHLTNAVNVAGYICWGWHSSLGFSYVTNGAVQWSGNSGWWIIRTAESFNGQRSGQFLQWFSSNAFGGTNYSNTPIGGPTYVEEPDADNTLNDILFNLWASGQNLAICCWAARNPSLPPYMQVVGDPFVTK